MPDTGTGAASTPRTAAHTTRPAAVTTAKKTTAATTAEKTTAATRETTPRPAAATTTAEQTTGAAETYAAPETAATTTEYILNTGSGELTETTQTADTSAETELTTETSTEDVLEENEQSEPPTGSLVMLIILFVCAVAAAIVYMMKRRKDVSQGGADEISAQTFINVRDIYDDTLYTGDGKAFAFVKIDGMPIDLYTNDELMTISKSLAAELVGVKFTWKFITVSRPMDLKHTLNLYNELQTTADSGRKQLLQLEEKELVKMVQSGGAIERQHYAIVWGHETKAEQVKKNADELMEILLRNHVSAMPLDNMGITELVNLVNMPQYTRLENRFDFDDVLAAILKE